MKQRRRIYYSETQRAEIWDRWKRGESQGSIGKRFDRASSSIYTVLCPTGGIRPVPRKRAETSLTLSEREEISRGLSAKQSIRWIAKQLNRSPSTISREIQRNGGIRAYRAAKADKLAWERAHRPKPCKLAMNNELRDAVSIKLELEWSPQQISGWLRREYPENDGMQVSHETIYKTLFIQARGALKKELQQHLRSKRAIRRSLHAGKEYNKPGQIPDMVSIRERPGSAEDRALPGHWEGDLIAGSNNSYIATLVERQTRYVMLLKVADRKTETVINALIEHAKRLPDELYKSLAWDRGKEMTDHKRFTLATDIKVYFCDPSSPWQRGSNENTNRLLRQYFPKRTDLSIHSQEHLDMIARRLNERPRQTLNFETPAERFDACVAATA
ncbi:Transposase [Mariprofundus ferrinatatus]|uniref:Transposase n=1 Tax=Mariprofundus ferrinatatus TaxID=1921087 RepID=A0A2K8L657_9PROT|nr:IS30 family transposase [Mariprofundus ferrinatatus]ATX82810.1 Transposase [Mariprofundus ferrinatatus]